MRTLIDLLFPPTCLSCDIAVESSRLCARCGTRLTRIPDACPRCGEPRCRGCAPPWDTSRAAAAYDGVARDAMLRFKLGGERRAASWLGGQMVDLLEVDAGMIVHVPSWPPVKRQRGFDPAEELARVVAARSGHPRRGVLRKVKPSEDSAALGRDARHQNLAGSFAALGSVPHAVTLIDDIMTTGATAAVCSAVLRSAGCQRVHIVTFARTLRR